MINAVIRLREWFGGRQFLVADLNDSQVEEIASILNIYPPELRSKVGRRLSRATLSATLANRTLSLSVVSRADGPHAAIYQIQER